MSWSKVNNKNEKPFKWWYHKILCELGWIFRKCDYSNFYYKHLRKLCLFGFNLYGDKI